MSVSVDFLLRHSDSDTLADVEAIDLCGSDMTGSFDLSGLDIPNLTEVFLRSTKFERIVIPQDIEFLDLSHSRCVREIEIRDGVSVAVTGTENIVDDTLTDIDDDCYHPDDVMVEWGTDQGILLYSN